MAARATDTPASPSALIERGLARGPSARVAGGVRPSVAAPAGVPDVRVARTGRGEAGDRAHAVRRLYTLCESHRGRIQIPDGRRSKPADPDPGELQGRLLDAYAVEVLPIERGGGAVPAPTNPGPASLRTDDPRGPGRRRLTPEAVPSRRASGLQAGRPAQYALLGKFVSPK